MGAILSHEGKLNEPVDPAEVHKGVEDGSTAIFAEAALMHLDSLYRYALRLTHNSAEAEDLVQETYCRAIRAAQTLPPYGNLKSWMCTILRNTWLNQLRKRRNGLRFTSAQGSADFGPTIIPTSDDPYRNFVRRSEFQAVRCALRTLPKPLREILFLRGFEGLSYEEIGKVLDLPQGTVMSRLKRARDKLRDKLCDWHLTST